MIREILCKSVALNGFQADALQKAKAVPLTPLAFEATEEAAATGLYKLLKKTGAGEHGTGICWLQWLYLLYMIMMYWNH